MSVQVAFFVNLDRDAGCDPQETTGLHWQGLAALANVIGHELSEARTDPDNPGVVRQELRGRTGISARGTSRWSRSAIPPRGRFRESGPTRRTTPEPAGPAAQAKKGVLTVPATSRSPHNTGKLNHAHPHDGCGWFGVFLCTQRVAIRREVTGHVVSRTMPLSALSSSPS